MGIDIFSMPNGVTVEILTRRHEGAPEKYTRNFQYDNSEGLFTLCEDECTFRNGVLLLVLKKEPRVKMRFGKAGHASLQTVDESAASTLAKGSGGAEHITTMSPSPSDSSL